MDQLQQLMTKHREIEEAVHLFLLELSNLEIALDQAVIIDKTDDSGKITYVNKKFCEVSKYSREELLGQNHRIINSGYHPKEYFRELLQTIGRGEIWKGEIRNKAKDGSIYWVETTIIPFLDKMNKPNQYIAVSQEISKRKFAQEVIRMFPQRIIQIQEIEKKKISQDLHDDLGQTLIALKMDLHSASSDAKTNRDDLKKACEEAMDSLDNIIEKNRHIAYQLHPSSFQMVGIAGSIERLIQDFKKNKKLEIQYHLGELNKVVFNGDMINFYRIIQEALTNIVKHAKASRIEINMSREKDRLLVKITDNGKGFDQHHQGQGMGVLIMRERALMLGSNLEIKSSLGAGTSISMDIPIKIKEETYA